MIQKFLKPLLVASLLSLPSYAQETEIVDRSWTKTEIYLETAFQMALFIDWKQTSEFHRSIRVLPDGTITESSERNPFLGSHPKQSTINIACLLSSLGHLGVSHLMGKDKKVWQIATLTLELIVVNNNYRLGVHIKW